MAESQTAEKTTSAPAGSRRSGGSDQSRRGGGNRRRDDRRSSRAKPEFDQKVLNIRRVSRVMEGGRRFSFRVALVAGDRRGRVGVGSGKANDTPTAIDKAFRDAKRNLLTVNTTDNMSIPCEVKAKYNASEVLMKPSPGKGVIAGSSVRQVIELAGLHDISTKLLSRSKNSLNNARAAIKTLSLLPAVQATETKGPKTASTGEVAEKAPAEAADGKTGELNERAPEQDQKESPVKDQEKN